LDFVQVVISLRVSCENNTTKAPRLLYHFAVWQNITVRFSHNITKQNLPPGWLFFISSAPSFEIVGRGLAPAATASPSPYNLVIPTKPQARGGILALPALHHDNA
jgi:hypothetical protein